MSRIIIVCWKDSVYNEVVKILGEQEVHYTSLPESRKIIADVTVTGDLELLRKAGLIHIYQ